MSLIRETGNGSPNRSLWSTVGVDSCRVFPDPPLDEVISSLEIVNSSLSREVLPAAWKRPQASWRRMLPTQLAVELEYEPNYWTDRVDNAYIFDTNKQRMGDVYEHIDKRYRQKL